MISPSQSQSVRALALLAALWAPKVWAQQATVETPRNGAIELRFGTYRPAIDARATVRSTLPNSMLLFEGELDRYVWQGVGAVGGALSAGYAEKYGYALSPTTGLATAERTAFKVFPLKLLALYRFDYLALHKNIPFVPYVKGGFAALLWHITKGNQLDTLTTAAGPRPAQGTKFGYTFTGGLSFMLDFLEPRLARDFDNDLGVNHTYFFAEFNYLNANSFGQTGLNLSSRHWMFGMAFEF
jgi:hypothetical protein